MNNSSALNGTNLTANWISRLFFPGGTRNDFEKMIQQIFSIKKKQQHSGYEGIPAREQSNEFPWIN